MSETAATMAGRMRALMPQGWFPSPPSSGEAETAPVLIGLLNGLGAGFALIYSLLGYANQQTRIGTATGAFLDGISADFFGPGALPRNTGETDIAYRARIKAALFPVRGTRAAVVAAVQAITGTVPLIVEPLNAADTKGRGSATAPAAGGGYGYGSAGLRYGSLSDPAQMFVTVTPTAYVLAETIYATIANVLPAGVIAWVHITNPAGTIGSFVVGYNTVS